MTCTVTPPAPLSSGARSPRSAVRDYYYPSLTHAEPRANRKQAVRSEAHRSARREGLENSNSTALISSIQCFMLGIMPLFLIGWWYLVLVLIWGLRKTNLGNFMPPPNISYQKKKFASITLYFLFKLFFCDFLFLFIMLERENIKKFLSYIPTNVF